MRELAISAKQEFLHFSSLSTITMVWRLRGETDVADAAQQMLAIANDADEPVLRMTAHQFIGGNRLQIGDFANARHHLEESVRVGDEVDFGSNFLAAMSLTSARAISALSSG